MILTIFLFVIFLLAVPLDTFALEFQGELSAEARLFTESPGYEDQEHHNGSLAIDAEVYQELTSATSFACHPFFRFDSANSERSHGDLRLCYLLHAPERWELTVGIDKVFWGVTEFVHLVDIINQTDILEGMDGEEKLGQPMVRLRMERDWGMIDSFLLPYFRVRSFPGDKDRLRGPDVIDKADAEFESGMEEFHPDVALRYSRIQGDWDFGLYQFFGTSREPLFITGEDDTLTPYYEQIAQTGLDLQLTKGKWLWKLEVLSRSSDSDHGLAATAGFEYTLSRLFGTAIDLGFIVEYVFDDRNIAEYSLYNQDLMTGLRLCLNDQGSTQLLTGFIQDTENHSTALSFELDHRINEFLSMEITAACLSNLDHDDPAAVYRQDSFVRVVATCYF